MTKVRITGRGGSSPGQSRIIEIYVDGDPAKAADHPRVRSMANILKSRYAEVTIEIVK